MVLTVAWEVFSCCMDWETGIIIRDIDSTDVRGRCGQMFFEDLTLPFLPALWSIDLMASLQSQVNKMIPWYWDGIERFTKFLVRQAPQWGGGGHGLGVLQY